MEYDTTTAQGASEANSHAHSSTTGSGQDGRLRVSGPQVDVSVLKETVTLPFSGRVAKNRFLKAPMTERLCHWPQDDGQDISARGFPSPEYAHLYQRWGEGEIGIIVAGNMMVRYDAVEAFGNPILPDDHDGRVAAFAKVTSLAKAHGSLIVAQLSHPGRQGPGALNPHPVSASDVHLKLKWAGNWFEPPRALTIPEIGEIVRQFGETAYLCHRAGFDDVEVHCAHGYLLAQFLALTTNKRTDEYGGDLANRSRIVFEVIAEIRRRVTDPSFIIGCKINSVEFQPQGQQPEDCRALCLKLEEAGIDYIELSGGTFEGRAFEHKKESTKARESYFIEFAELIRPTLKKTKLYVTGGFRTASGMTRAIHDGAMDGIGIGRPLGAEPYLCKEILEGKVTGAIENFMPLPKNTQGTGSQLHQIGGGHRLVSDWSAAHETEEARKTSILPKVDSSGYPSLEAEAGFAYLR